MSEVQNPNPSDLSTQHSELNASGASEASPSPTSSPESQDSPSPALVPSASAEGVDTNPSELISSAPNASPALPKPQRGERAIAQGEALGVDPLVTLSPEGATQSNNDTSTSLASPPPETPTTPPEPEISDADREYLAKLHASMNPPPPFMPMNAALKKFKETHAIKLESMDPHDPECQFILDRLAELNYHAAVERAETACDKVGFNMNKFPNAMKELNKAVSTLQREKARQARERASKEKEQLRREREERAAQRAKEKQAHEERKLQQRIELEKQKALKEEHKAYRQTRRADQKFMGETIHRHNEQTQEPTQHFNPRGSPLNRCIETGLP